MSETHLFSLLAIEATPDHMDGILFPRPVQVQPPNGEFQLQDCTVLGLWLSDVKCLSIVLTLRNHCPFAGCRNADTLARRMTNSMRFRIKDVGNCYCRCIMMYICLTCLQLTQFEPILIPPNMNGFIMIYITNTYCHCS